MNNKTYQKLIWVFVAIAAITYGCSTYKAAIQELNHQQNEIQYYPPTDPRFYAPPNTPTRDAAPKKPVRREYTAPNQINQQGGRLREKNGYAAPPQQDQQAARLRLKEDQKLQDAARLRREEDQEAIAHLQQARKKEARLHRKGEKHKAARVKFHQGVQKKKPLHTIDEGDNYP